MMRRQRCIYTLPFEDNSSLFLNSDNGDATSNTYSYPETIYSQFIPPETDGFIPYDIYQYPCVEIPVEPFLNMPGNIYAPMSLTNLYVTDDFYSFNDDIRNIYNTRHDCSSMACRVGSNLPALSSLVSFPEKFEDILNDKPKTYPQLTSYGAVTILLRHLIRVDISPNKALYVTNPPANCIAAVNGAGNKSCVIHPNGRVHHMGQDVHMETLNQKAKICRRGIVFTSTEHCLSYLVDDSGTKTTAARFQNLNRDFSLEVFYSEGIAENSSEECYMMVNETDYKSYQNGDEVWMIGGFRIKQNDRGDVMITRNGNRYVIRTSPTAGEMSVKIDSLEINIGRYLHNYFFVRKEEKQVMAREKGFRVQNGAQKAGFNSWGKVVLF